MARWIKPWKIIAGVYKAPAAALLFFLFAAAGAQAQSFSGTSDLDAAINQAILENRLPGAVLLVGHQGRVIHRKAYGNRALVPQIERMTPDTIFDCASLTKVVATTASVMKLFEQGKIRLADRVTEYLPEFQNGTSDITIRDLMTHFSGLRPDLDLIPAWSGYSTGIERALHDPPAGPPRVKFVYSDINFILMGEIVRRISGMPLNEYAKQNVFTPLGMGETTFLPPLAWRSRIAPTERLKTGEVLRGSVHDDTARYMGGVAGHAGLFSTADDLARFCQMMLNKGRLDETRIFSPLAVDLFTAPQSPIDQPALRGIGWDIDSPLSGNRGELFPPGLSYGHTGFTGTSIWIDPTSQTYVILLANSVHPERGHSLTSLRGRVATVVAAQVGIERQVSEESRAVRTGLDVLEEQNFGSLAGRRVGLITNHTGIDRQGRRNVDVMLAGGVKVTALFSPEHGIAGAEDQENITNSQDKATGVKVYSLFGKTQRPTAAMLRNIDVLVFDIQDIGTRFYTYVSTMGMAMEEAGKMHIPFIVLDRPNPITGVHVEGPVLDSDKLSFVGYFPLPLRHGMTAGELAQMFNAENHMGADLSVVRMDGWRRTDWFDQTNLPWVSPSPNIRNLTEATLYPGIAMLEYSTNYTVGRGTDSPFEVIGAEFIKGTELAGYLNARGIGGVRCYPVRFTPTASHLAGVEVEGVRFLITNRDILDSSRLGIEVAAALQHLYPGKLSFEVNTKLIGNAQTLEGLEKGGTPASGWNGFAPLRAKYLLYR